MNTNINVFFIVVGCGFLYKEHEIAIAKNIIRNTCSFQCLPQHTYGYTSTIAVR